MNIFKLIFALVGALVVVLMAGCAFVSRVLGLPPLCWIQFIFAYALCYWASWSSVHLTRCAFSQSLQPRDRRGRYL